MSGGDPKFETRERCGDCAHFEECAVCFGDHEDDNACGEFARVTAAHRPMIEGEE